MTRTCPGFAVVLLAAVCAATCPEPVSGQGSASGTAAPALQPLSAPQLPPEAPLVGRAPYAPDALVPDNTTPQRSVVLTSRRHAH